MTEPMSDEQWAEVKQTMESPSIPRHAEAVNLCQRLFREVERLRIIKDKLQEGFNVLRHIPLNHMGHWDSTMRGGAGCPMCNRHRELNAKADAIVGEAAEQARKDGAP